MRTPRGCYRPRDARGLITFHENEKCSSGTGETMVRLARRLGLEIEEADRLASRATDAIPITARCSVFAKSELTHFANQGRPLDALSDRLGRILAAV